MAIDLSGLTSAANTLTALGGVAMVTPKYTGYTAQKADKSLEQSSMLFHIEADNKLSLKSEITDHVVEDNTVVSDQIATKPEIVTVRGLIGELNTVLPEALQAARVAREKLILVSVYVPELTVSSLRVLNAAEQAYRLAENLKSQFAQGFGGDSASQNKQQVFFQKFYSYWKNKTLFTVQTPWTIFEDMAIQTLNAVQGEGTKEISDFEITFKKIRFASTAFQSAKDLSGRSSNQSSTLKDNGLRAGQSTPASFGSLLA